MNEGWGKRFEGLVANRSLRTTGLAAMVTLVVAMPNYQRVTDLRGNMLTQA